MIQTDFLIIGQGIAGTLLSLELIKHGKKVLVIDKENPYKSSLVAGAVLNPMAGKHWSPSPQAALFLPKAHGVYSNIEKLLSISILQETKLYVFHESEEKQLQFEQKQELFPQYLSIADSESPYFNALYCCGIISGVSVINAPLLLSSVKSYLLAQDAFIEEDFDENLLEIEEDKVHYKNISASKIIFCNGVSAATGRFFQSLPFTKNRGEVLMLDIPALPEDAVYHQKLRLVPKGNHQFWCGSNYKWDFEDLLPDEQWRKESEAELKSWLKIPFEIKNHIVAQRPTTAGQIPFVGFHPEYKTIAIFNGLGTRGFSSGPYWANELAQKLLDPNYLIRKL
ncbi:FAD-binding oxidoreductase [Taibaiella lutea]|uniref:FAD-binding oxidoreductase n=1 Tax=Taibaiella lutea TaxID=2608001 RepID=A0A5M6CEL4_9BACT|nr:FAD-binding oxidoreductase [Taibaiella lutea]KAA5533614.1 FAD-binding oxidoreductase [Taibaiella lutea]